ncbi:hypothetical protein POPTR_008G221102v4 [Populus trichocarpa]|uniref:Uncharacterized protein n=1 Tax=Populus trichocarpa TaxID=3694 RepID=A0ACC0SN83_POPTR|nr:hypothetical protein BDE02_08G198500 [Populus trichocarpa]KAI9390727.1 hypothetical protein POPTR_008G221102v4 [Populus trichocarpa]
MIFSSQIRSPIVDRRWQAILGVRSCSAWKTIYSDSYQTQIQDPQV